MAAHIAKGGEYLIAETVCTDVFTPEDFTDEQRSMADTTEQFVANEIMPNLDEIEHQNFALVVEKMKKCGDLGLLMMDAPEAIAASHTLARNSGSLRVASSAEN